MREVGNPNYYVTERMDSCVVKTGLPTSVTCATHIFTHWYSYLLSMFMITLFDFSNTIFMKRNAIAIKIAFVLYFDHISARSDHFKWWTSRVPGSNPVCSYPTEICCSGWNSETDQAEKSKQVIWSKVLRYHIFSFVTTVDLNNCLKQVK